MYHKLISNFENSPIEGGNIKLNLLESLKLKKYISYRYHHSLILSNVGDQEYDSSRMKTLQAIKNSYLKPNTETILVQR